VDVGGERVSSDLEAPPAPGAGDGGYRRPRPVRGFGAALGLTVLGALVPGTAFLAAGRRKLGAITLVLFVLLLGAGVWLGTAGQRTAIRLAVSSSSLVWIIAGVAVVALLWVVVIAAGYRMLIPRRLPRFQHALGALLVLLLAAGVALPAFWVVRLADAQRGLIDGVFAEHKSATVQDTPDPFAGKDRVNVLLLGGDSGPDRDGLRTDTVIVASLDTHTGDTTLFSLPRNLENLPFPANSPLGPLYPNGFESGDESESLLNAVYRNGPADHPGVLGPTDDEGADWLKLGVGEALGLHIDYFVLVNLEGFSRLVDALGGITVNINYWVPIGGIPDQQLPDDYFAPGPDQHLDGWHALQFARGRYGLTDYDRMARQRCTVNAIIDAADPVTVLSKYQDIAETTQDIVSTDIPQSALSDFVDLGFLVKDAEVRSVVFDNTLIDPAYPDYDQMRALVRDSLAPPSAAPTTSPAPTTTDPGTAGETPPPATSPVAEVGDACAYDPQQAQEALAAGEPPTRTG
jgi:LCP family protein required for cell wall assembly